MSIIINTGGSGSTPDLQQVLTAGSTLSISNSIYVNSPGELSIELSSTNFKVFGDGSGSAIVLGAANNDLTIIGSLSSTQKGGLFVFCDLTNNYNLVYSTQFDGSNHVNNYFQINPDSEIYFLGDYAQLNSLGFIKIDATEIFTKSNYFKLREITSATGQFMFEGADGGYWTNSPGNQAATEHLIVYVNGNKRYIALKKQ